MIRMNENEPAVSQQQQTCQVSSYTQLGANPKDSIAIPHPVNNMNCQILKFVWPNSENFITIKHQQDKK